MSDSLESVQRSAPEPEGVARVKTVLVVDDAESERTAIRTAIESRTKFRVCGEASNGVEAIRKANELRPDLVLMDLAMPQMNGLEAAKVLRNTPVSSTSGPTSNKSTPSGTSIPEKLNPGRRNRKQNKHLPLRVLERIAQLSEVSLRDQEVLCPSISKEA
jgi:CheY-like chemotaxis protein